MNHKIIFNKFKILINIVFLVLITTTVSATQSTESVFKQSKNIIDYSQIIYGAVIVFLFLAAFIFILNKYRLNKYSNEGLVQVISSYPLSAKEKIQIIRVGQKYLLIGVSNSGINKIHELQKDEIEIEIPVSNTKKLNFSNLFAATLGKYNHA